MKEEKSVTQIKEEKLQYIKSECARLEKDLNTSAESVNLAEKLVLRAENINSHTIMLDVRSREKFSIYWNAGELKYTNISLTVYNGTETITLEGIENEGRRTASLSHVRAEVKIVLVVDFMGVKAHKLAVINKAD